MPFPVGNVSFPVAISDNHNSCITRSDTSPEMSGWEKIKEFFCSANKPEALEIIRQIYHPPAGTTRDEVAGRFERLRTLAYAGFGENVQSGRYGENHFSILLENSQEMLSVTLDDAGVYTVKCQGYHETHHITPDLERGEECPEHVEGASGTLRTEHVPGTTTPQTETYEKIRAPSNAPTSNINSSQQNCSRVNAVKDNSDSKIAKTVVDAFRRTIARNVYRYMFSTGTVFQQNYNEWLEKNPGADALTYLEQKSLNHLVAIRECIGECSADEKEFLKSLESTPWRFRHCSEANLVSNIDGNEKVTIHSNKSLSQKNNAFRDLTAHNDRTVLSNDDFVFFGLELAYDIAEKRPILSTEHSGNDYGRNAYLFSENTANIRSGYMTLTDHLHNTLSIKPPKAKEFPLLYKECERISEEEYDAFLDGSSYEHRKITEPNTNIVPIFSFQHMKEALGLYMINELRKVREIDADFANFALNAPAGPIFKKESLVGRGGNVFTHEPEFTFNSVSAQHK